MQPNPIMIAPYPIYATAPLINFYFDFEIDFDPFLWMDHIFLEIYQKWWNFEIFLLEQQYHFPIV